jgi:hypothetical protein
MGLTRGTILDKRIVPLRSVVYDPMNFDRLYLLGTPRTLFRR